MVGDSGTTLNICPRYDTFWVDTPRLRPRLPRRPPEPLALWGSSFRAFTAC